MITENDVEELSTIEATEVLNYAIARHETKLNTTDYDLLLSLLNYRNCLGVRALVESGVNLEELSKKALALSIDCDIYNGNLNSIIEKGRSSSRGDGMYLGTEHLVLGLMAGDSAVSKLLRNYVNLIVYRAEVAKLRN